MSTQHATDHAAIRRQIDTLAEAVCRHDLDSLTALYTSDIVSFDIQPPLQHLGVEGKGKNWIDVFTVYQRPMRYEVRDLTITIGDDVAFSHSFNRLSGTLKNGTATKGVWVRFTACFRRIDGNWLIAHDHVSTPVDFASRTTLLDLEP